MSLAKGERLAVMGSSGAGKTTLLKILAKLRKYVPTSGKLEVQANPILLFQQPLLLDHLTVEDNIRLPCLIHDLELPISDITSILALTEVVNRYPFQISGGQQRRVALARALVSTLVSPREQPTCLLLDEPFAGTDELLREKIIGELDAGLKLRDTGAILTTHSPFEAVLFADRILFLGRQPTKIVSQHIVSLSREQRVDATYRQDVLAQISSVQDCLRDATPIENRV